MRRIWVVAALVAASGCAALGTADQAPDPAVQLEAGLAALEQGEYSRARSHFGWVYSTNWDRPVGRYALLALIAADIDPRNPDRRLDGAADLAARLIVSPDAPGWTGALAESIYLVALELGADEARLARAIPADSLAPDPLVLMIADTTAPAPLAARLPHFDGPTVPARLAAAAAERDSLLARIGRLEEAVAARDRQIREKDQELERIRKIIKG